MAGASALTETVEGQDIEAERLLRELEQIIDYWDYRACVATTEKAVALFLKKKRKCRKMADDIVRSAQRVR